MMHNNAHIAAVDLDGHNDVVFQKTLAGERTGTRTAGTVHPLGSTAAPSARSRA